VSTDDAADEFEIIRHYFAPLAANAPGAFNLQDDAATITPNPGFEIVITTDAIVAGVHFLEDESPRNIAAKLCGSNLSDLAAMGAKPIGFTLACAWPKGTSLDTIAAFAAGLREWVDGFDFPLLGGDTVSTPGPATFSLTAIGEVATGQCLRRNGARPGDKIFVTGTIGDGVLGLLAAQGKLNVIDADYCAFLEDRFRRPNPRVSAGQALVGQAHACLDISDGLVQDLSHMADASGVSIRLDAASVPLSPAAQVALNTDPQLLSTILSGGDDYELLISAAKMPTSLDVLMTEIGTVVAGPASVFTQGKDGEEIPLANTGYNHFK